MPYEQPNPNDPEYREKVRRFLDRVDQAIQKGTVRRLPMPEMPPTEDLERFADWVGAKVVEYFEKHGPVVTAEQREKNRRFLSIADQAIAKGLVRARGD